MIKILLIGKSGRIDCIADAIMRSPKEKELYSFSEVNNPGLAEKSVEPVRWGGRTDDVEAVLDYAREIKPDLVFIGPEEPLEAGVVNALEDQLGISTIGPRSELAKIETSKSFTRELLSQHGIPGNPEHRVFRDMTGVEEYLKDLREFVVKPDGLTGGKGVKVMGEHLFSIEDAKQYCEELFEAGQASLVIEEKLVGEEFSLQAFCDGEHVINTIPIQDHKRAYEGDSGSNTGGMGSYSCADHLLPFLDPMYLDEARQINKEVAGVLRDEATGAKFKGILYGGFMVTSQGLRLIEYNARFGDPEVMNLLPILETDFIDVCGAIRDGTLHKLDVSFQKKATVCKYVVPESYPNSSEGKDNFITVDNSIFELDEGRLFYGAVHMEGESLKLIGSRAIACVGIGNTLEEAENVAEQVANSIHGKVRHRSDIGRQELINKRIAHIRTLFSDHADGVMIAM